MESLRIIKQEALDLRGMRFETRRKIEMPAKEDDLDESLLSQDTVFEKVESAARTRLKESAAGPRGSL